MRVFALDDDDKLQCDNVIMNWVLYPFHDDIIVMTLLIVLISHLNRRRQVRMKSTLSSQIEFVIIA